MATGQDNAEGAAYQARLEDLLLRQRDRHRAAQAADARAMDRLRGDLHTAEARIAELLSELTHAHGELDAMRHSTSWRLTAPLRWLRHLFGA